MTASQSELDAVRSRALSFVEAHGDDAAAQRARALLREVGPADALAAIEASLPEEDDALGELRIAELQRALGGLDDLMALDGQLSRRVCRAVGRRQEADGSWFDGGSASEAERIFTTGMIAGHLAKTPYVRDSSLQAAADYLSSRWDPDRVKGAAFGATAAYAHCFALIRHDDSDAILQWCGRELGRGLLTGVYDAVRTARILAWCRAHGLPGASFDRAELLGRLVAEQREDGGYTPGDDAEPRRRVAHTLDALVGLVRLS